MSAIIDRRPNDRSGSAVNRERFMRRYRAQIRQAVADMVADRSIRDMERGGKVGTVVTSVIRMAKWLGIPAVAEGVFVVPRFGSPVSPVSTVVARPRRSVRSIAFTRACASSTVGTGGGSGTFGLENRPDMPVTRPPELRDRLRRNR